MPIQPAFPTPVYLQKAFDDQYETIQKELWDTYNSLDFYHNEVDNDHDLSVGEDGSLFTENVLDRFNCTNFLSFIHDNLMQFMDELGYNGNREYYVLHSWFTRTLKGQHAPLHDHGSIDVSGVYYLQTNRKDGDLIFYSPHRNLVSSFLYSIVDGTQGLPPDEGLLAFWPGLLYHTTETNRTDSVRISVSFNIQFARDGFTLQNANTN